MSEEGPVARSPITPAPPVVVEQGWEVSARHGTAPLRISDASPLTKVLVRAPETGQAREALGVPFGRAARTLDGMLVVGSGPGEWLVLAAPNQQAETVARVGQAAGDDEFVSVFDITHGRALVRLTGAAAAGVLSKLCAIDLSDTITPDGAAFRSSVAKLVTDVIRDDQAGARSYLLHCERSSGQYLFDALLDAGEEFGIDFAGFTFPGI